ncbi:hypothetical protein PVAP13_8KG265901 [Panicum virgatum]|uniref:Uncharacterized protein n=1 Tax=Panicum virgatum TaxID=38727 RepID=A0A8T0PIT7_PANVG|nr:hypothetical protein PVAP13_8KG265901 [Panicum virgatum]
MSGLCLARPLTRGPPRAKPLIGGWPRDRPLIRGQPSACPLGRVHNDPCRPHTNKETYEEGRWDTCRHGEQWSARPTWPMQQ